MRGVLIFAHSSETIELARECARRVHLYLKVKVCLVTSEYFEPDEDFDFIRSDPAIGEHSHWLAYEMTPFDETIILDYRYMIFSSQTPLRHLFIDSHSIFGTSLESDFKIGLNANTLMGQDAVGFINPATIPSVCASVIFFKRSVFVENIFLTALAVVENWKFFSKQYQSTAITPDHVFAIALHLNQGSRAPIFRDFFGLPFKIKVIRDVEQDKLRALTDSEAFIVFDGIDCKRSIVLTGEDLLFRDIENLLNMVRKFNAREELKDAE